MLKISLLNAIKQGQLKNWLFEVKNGHPFLLEEEADIIIDVRFDPRYKWMNEYQIKKLVNLRIKQMYKTKFPNAKQWTWI